MQANEVNRKFSTARVALKKGDVLKCLHQFKEALGGFETVHVLPAEKAVLEGAISALQTDLTSNEGFKKVFGPVTFSDADVESTTAFLGELIKVYEEQVVEGMKKDDTEPGPVTEGKPEPADLSPEDPIEAIIDQIKSEKQMKPRRSLGATRTIDEGSQPAQRPRDELPESRAHRRGDQHL